MTDAVATLPADDYVLVVNGWSKRIVLPAFDTSGNPVTWGNFTVTTSGASAPTIALASGGTPPVVTLSVPAGSLKVGTFHWYLAESAVYTGNVFLSGTVHVEALDG